MSKDLLEDFVSKQTDALYQANMRQLERSIETAVITATLYGPQDGSVDPISHEIHELVGKIMEASATKAFNAARQKVVNVVESKLFGALHGDML